MNEDLSVRFGAETAGLEAGVDRSKSKIGEVKAPVTELEVLFERMKTVINTAFSTPGSGLKNTATEASGALEFMRGVVEGLEAELRDTFQAPAVNGLMLAAKETQVSLAATAASSGAAAVGITEVGAASAAATPEVATLGAVMDTVLPLLVAVGAAFMAVRGMSEWSEKAADAAEHTQNLSDSLGIAIPDVMRLSALANMLGFDTDKVAAATARLDKAMMSAQNGSRQQAAAFSDLGIDTTQVYTQMELLTLTMDQFSKMEDGPRKVALAMSLFGRAGADLIPFLNQGAEGLRKLTEAQEKYGFESLKAQQIASQLDDNLDENKLAFKGLGNVIMEELGPGLIELVGGINDMIEAFVKSYREGGAAKKMFEVLGTTVHGLTIIFGFVYTVIYQVVSRIVESVSWLGTQIEIMKIGAKRDLDLVGLAFANLGLAMAEALIGPWPGIQKAMDDNLASMVAKANLAQVQINSLRFQQMAAFNGSNAQATGFSNWVQGGAHWGPYPNPNAPPKPPKPEGNTGNMPSYRPAPGGGGGDTRVQKWQEELHSMQIASGEFFRDETAAELAFWETKLAQTTAGSKAWLQVQELIFTAKKKLAQEAYAEEISLLDEQIQNAHENNAEQDRLMNEKVAKVKAIFGEESKEYKSALREQRRLALEHQADLLRITVEGMERVREAARQGAEADRAEQQAADDIAMSALEARERAGEVSATRVAVARAVAHQREFAAEVAFQERMFALWVADEQRKAAMAHEQGRLDEEVSINAGIEAARTKFYADMRALAAQQSAEMVQDNAQVMQTLEAQWQGVFKPIGDGFGAMISNMVTGARSWADIWNNIGLSMLNNITNWLAEWLTKYLAHQLAMTGITMFGETTRAAIKEGGVAVDAGVELQKTAITAAGVGARTGIELAGAAASKSITIGTAIAEIGANAARAAAGAYAAIAGIPVVGPFLAPVAAAAALAGVLALGKSIFSAEGGWGEVPFDGAQTTLHKGEMVLPQSLAQPLRAQLQSGGHGSGAIGNAAAKAFSPTLNFHTLDGPSMRRWWDRNGDEMVKQLERKYRAFAAGVP